MRLTVSLLLVTQTIAGGSVFAYPYEEQNNTTPTTTTTTSGTTPSGGHRGENYIAPIIRLDERVIARKRRASSLSSSSSMSSSSRSSAPSPVCTQELSNTWTALGQPGFVNLKEERYSADQAFAYAADGTAYVAFKDTSDKATVMKSSGTTWVTVGSAGFSKESIRNINVAVAANGKVYVSYLTNGQQPKARVMTFDGTSWTQVGADLGQRAISASLAIAPDGTPYLSYINFSSQSFTSSYSAYVVKFDGSKWAPLPDAGNNSPNYRKLAFAPDGTLYMALSDDTVYSKASVMKFDGQKWSYVGKQGFSDASSAFFSLAFKSDGTPFIAFMEVMPLRVMTFNGSDWVHVGSRDISTKDRQAAYQSLVIDTNGRPVVAFGEMGKAHVMAYDGSGWTLLAPALPQIGLSLDILNLAPDGSISLHYKNNSGSTLQTLKMIKTCTTARSTSSVSASSVSSARSIASVASSSSSSTASSLSGDVRCVQTDILNVRADSRIDAAILRVANKGERMQVLRVVHEDWAQIGTPDGRGAYVWVQNLGQCSPAPSPASSCVPTSSLKKPTSSLRGSCTTNAGQSVSVSVSRSDR